MNEIFRGARDDSADGEVFGSVYNKRVVTRLAPYILPHKGMLVLGTLAMLGYVATQLAVPWLIKVGIDGFVADGNSSSLTWVFALFIGVALMNWASGYGQELAMAKVGQGVLYGLRRHMFSHLQKLPLSFYDKSQVGRIISRVQGDVSQLQEFSHLIVMTLGDMLSLAGIVVALLIMNLKLGLISMVVLPILIVIMAVWQSYAKKAFMEVRRRRRHRKRCA